MIKFFQLNVLKNNMIDWIINFIKDFYDFFYYITDNFKVFLELSSIAFISILFKDNHH